MCIHHDFHMYWQNGHEYVTVFVLQIKNFHGFDKQKLELKYDVFWKRATLEEEFTYRKLYKVKAGINSASVCFSIVLL
jgi:hypothetical protein